jgi:UDP-3-O-[3-hydroxymyristoyl] N-acetylglucosamine deacetylase
VRQKTLSHSVSCNGPGIHTGQDVRLTLNPAPADTGIVFRRTDLPAEARKSGADRIEARYVCVTDTRLGTTISNEYGTSVATIEHLMAALAGLGVDNAEIEIDGPEVPIMDGSAAPFVFLIECAGLRSLAARRRVLRVLQTVGILEDGKRAEISPADALTVDVEIDFSSAAVRRQRLEMVLSDPSAFKAELARARTFGFLHEVEHLRKNGLARGGSLQNVVVIDGDVVLNEEGLRFGDEFVRHKVLDAVGDLALAGFSLQGRFHGVRSGHALNNRLLRKLFATEGAYEILRSGAETSSQRPAYVPSALPLAATA